MPAEIDDAYVSLRATTLAQSDAPAPAEKPSPPRRSRVGVGWVSQVLGKQSLRVRQELEAFAATVDAECLFRLGDDLDPAISLEDFVRSEAKPSRVDTVELLVLAGHGGGSNAGLFLPGGKSVKPGAVFFGATLRWVVIDACCTFERDLYDPLQWRRVFDGLHQLLGSSISVSDSVERGRIFAGYLNEGKAVWEAWRRALEETDDAPTRATVMVPAAVASDILGETLHAPAPLARESLGGDFQIIDVAV